MMPNQAKSHLVERHRLVESGNLVLPAASKKAH
jgi:hypothetical protein